MCLLAQAFLAVTRAAPGKQRRPGRACWVTDHGRPRRCRLRRFTPGKVADHVVLDANPLERINAVRRIDTVITRGRVLDRTRLDQMLADVEAAAQAPATQAARDLPVHNCCQKP